MWDARNIGTALTPFEVTVDAGRLGNFARATGQTDPVYYDEVVARAKGYPSLPVPPTFFFCLEMDGPDPMAVYERLGVDYARVLHGEQHFDYHRLVFAGETLHFKPRIVDLYERQGGALRFIVWETQVDDAAGLPVARLRSVMVVCPPSKAGATQVRRYSDCGSSERLPEVVAGPITRHVLGWYAGASGDYNPLHIDSDFARRAGMSDVFAHGMLSAAYLSRVVTDWTDASHLLHLRFRFVAITPVGDQVHGRGHVVAPVTHAGQAGLSLALTAHNQNQEIKVLGTAIVARAGAASV